MHTRLCSLKKMTVHGDLKCRSFQELGQRDLVTRYQGLPARTWRNRLFEIFNFIMKKTKVSLLAAKPSQPFNAQTLPSDNIYLSVFLMITLISALSPRTHTNWQHIWLVEWSFVIELSCYLVPDSNNGFLSTPIVPDSRPLIHTTNITSPG